MGEQPGGAVYGVFSVLAFVRLPWVNANGIAFRMVGAERPQVGNWHGNREGVMLMAGRVNGNTLRAANKTLLASLPDLAVLLVLSAVVRLARIAALGFVSHSKLVCFLLDFPAPV